MGHRPMTSSSSSSSSGGRVRLASMSAEDMAGWLGRKVRMYELETNNLCRLVFTCWKSWARTEGEDVEED